VDATTPVFKYNTVSHSGGYGIANVTGGDIRFNIFNENDVAVSTTANNINDLSVNAFYSSTTANYSNVGAVNSLAKYSDNLDDPTFTAAASIDSSDVATGSYAGIYNILPFADFTPLAASYANHSEIGSSLGAYNIITAIEADTSVYQSPRREYVNTYMKNGNGLSLDVYSVLKDADCSISINNLDSTQSDINCVQDDINKQLYQYEFTLDANNTRADGNYIISTTLDNGDFSETLTTANTAQITLDNTGPATNLVSFTNGSAIAENTLVQVNLEDGSGIGGVKFEYSLEDGIWQTDQNHLVIRSGGGDTYNVGAIKINDEIVVDQSVGINLVELHPTNFTLQGTQYFESTEAGMNAFRDYLAGLTDGSLISFVVKHNAYFANNYASLIGQLRKLGFDGDFNAYDSVAFVGYKGQKKVFSITHIEANENDQYDSLAEINLSTEHGMFNSAVTLDTSCYNDDGSGNCHVKVRATDYLGNIGDSFNINYTVN
jgi:hypothetical protein